MIRFENVGMRYGSGPEVLRDVTFRVPPGAFRFVVGPSGAGKTSLLRLLNLTLAPSRGAVSLFGEDVATAERARLRRLRRRIGVVFQDFRLLDHMTAVQNVALPLRIAGADPRQIEEYVRELLNWVGLSHRMDARPSTLSGGEQQRVAIARAVITRPDLLLADEPTGNVDDEAGARMLRLFEQLNRTGTTVVVATHDEAMVQKFDYPVIHMRDGHLFPNLSGPDDRLAALRSRRGRS